METISVVEASERLGVCRRWVREMARLGKIPGAFLNVERGCPTWRIPVEGEKAPDVNLKWSRKKVA